MSLVACGSEPATGSAADRDGGGELALLGAWIRPTPPITNVGAFYLTIRNRGSGVDRVVAAAVAPLRRGRDPSDRRPSTGSRRWVWPRAGELEVGPAVTSWCSSRPGLHVMCLGLDEPVVEGERVPLTIEFDSGTGSLTTEAEAENR